MSSKLGRGFILFDIDGIVRDVTNSYRLAIKKTVLKFTGFEPSINLIDNLKSEGIWNNDWDLTHELIVRHKLKKNNTIKVPNKQLIIDEFNSFYFGGDLDGDFNNWKGFIKNEELLVNKEFFNSISKLQFKWGFFSGAERPSANYVLLERLKLNNPRLIAMGEAPDKPNPKGFIELIEKLSKESIQSINLPMIYVGDTVSDIMTINNARKLYPNKKFLSFGVAPPHLHKKEKLIDRKLYEKKLLSAGADFVFEDTYSIINFLNKKIN